MSGPTLPPRVDDDGVRTSTPKAGTARALGVVMIAAALTVVAASATAVWWLRRDPARSGAPTTTTAVVAPPVRVAAHAVRPAAARPSTASSAATAQHAAEAARRAATSPPAAGLPTPGTRTAPAAGGSGSVDAVYEAGSSDAERARVEQHDAREIAKAAQEVIDGMRAAGATTGLAAIPPPGTNPVKPGVVVPKDFELPEGYIRHYQTTDDGKRLEPILMFSPDYEFVDEQGKPIELPKDGIVPPEMVPPGMQVRLLDVPEGPGTKRGRPASDGQ
jgi:hypothetical protein